MNSGTRLDVAFGGVFVPERLGTCAPATVRKYRRQISRLEVLVGRRPVVGDLVDETVGALLEGMAEGGAAVETRESARQCFAAMAKFFAERGALPERLSVPTLGKYEEKPAPAWTDEEFSRLLGVCGDMSHMHNGIVRGLYWRSLLGACHDTGQPMARVLSGRFDRFDSGRCEITLPTGFARKVAAHAVRPATAGAIEAIRYPARESIWAWPKSASLFSADLNALLEDAGLREDHVRQSRLWALREPTA